MLVLNLTHAVCFFSLLSIPSVVVTISILASPQQSGGMHPLDARSVSSLPVVLADCVEQRPSRTRKTNVCLHNKMCPNKFHLPFDIFFSFVSYRFCTNTAQHYKHKNTMLGQMLTEKHIRMVHSDLVHDLHLLYVNI